MTRPPPRSGALRALTAAALALPGLMAGSAQAAEGDEFTFEYRHYEEGERNLDGESYRNLQLRPLEVDSFAAGVHGSLADDVKFGLDYSQDTWSGATPITTAPHAAVAAQLFSGASVPTFYSVDPKHRPVVVNFNAKVLRYTRDSRLVDVMSTASPETRRQISAKLGYVWDPVTLNIGGGISDEPDYKSRFFNLDGSADLNRKLTTLSWGASYTASDIAASEDTNRDADMGNYPGQISLKDRIPTLYGTRHDIAADIGVTQILDRDSLLSGTFSYTHDSGYLSDPYKATLLAFEAPHQPPGVGIVLVEQALEQRPTVRNQFNFDARFIQYIAGTDAALHVDYKFFHDDWGIDAHALELNWYQPLGDGWMVVPGLRYYTQSAADFYKPFFLFNQPFPTRLPANPALGPRIDFSKLPIKYFSSDERLSGYGSLGGQIAISKQIRDDLKFEVGAEYSAREGSLKLGGGGESGFADLTSYSVYAQLKFDLTGRDPLSDYRKSDDGGGAAGSDAGPVVWDISVPAGVRFAHLLEKPGDYAISLHHDWSLLDGETLRGTEPVSNAAIAKLDCGGTPCLRRDSAVDNHVTSLDLSYSPLERVTLMVTPQLVDTHQDQTALGPAGVTLLNHPGQPSPPGLRHTATGLGDTGVTALGSILKGEGYELDAGLGLSLPSGSIDKRINTGSYFLNYGLQPGSGTVDFTPSVTYLGHSGRFAWGSQVTAVKRLESRNADGYALGDIVQGSVWGSVGILPWLSASLRGIGTWEGGIEGQFKPHIVPTRTGFKLVHGLPVPIYKDVLTPQVELGPMDQPGSYGGRYGDIAVGMSAVVPRGAFAGNRLSVEWRVPVADDVNGYQLSRVGTLSVTWDTAF
ncbi:MAG TPA: DUF3570 domain-containing protein [Alphaproteobacteria bacterium]|nr:DUF3570 domain-containing protein [Alphaproteobacteria bacterium]